MIFLRFLVLTLFIAAVSGCSSSPEVPNPTAQGTENAGGGSVEQSTVAQVKASILKMQRQLADQIIYENTFDLFKQAKKLYPVKKSKMATTALNFYVSMMKPSYVKKYNMSFPDYDTDPSLKCNSPIQAIGEVKVNFKEGGPCIDIDHEASDAAVSEYSFNGSVCFSIKKLRRLPPGALDKHIYGLWWHEIMHLSGVKDEDTAKFMEKWATFAFKNYNQHDLELFGTAVLRTFRLATVTKTRFSVTDTTETLGEKQKVSITTYLDKAKTALDSSYHMWASYKEARGKYAFFAHKYTEHYKYMYSYISYMNYVLKKHPEFNDVTELGVKPPSVNLSDYDGLDFNFDAWDFRGYQGFILAHKLKDLSEPELYKYLVNTVNYMLRYTTDMYRAMVKDFEISGHTFDQIEGKKLIQKIKANSEDPNLDTYKKVFKANLSELHESQLKDPKTLYHRFYKANKLRVDILNDAAQTSESCTNLNKFNWLSEEIPWG